MKSATVLNIASDAKTIASDTFAVAGYVFKAILNVANNHPLLAAGIVGVSAAMVVASGASTLITEASSMLSAHTESISNLLSDTDALVTAGRGSQDAVANPNSIVSTGIQNMLSGRRM